NLKSGNMAGECVAGSAAPTVDVIHFAIPGSSVHTITPATQFEINEPVTIDGYSQTRARANFLAIGDNAGVLIEIDGGSLANAVFRLGGPITANDSSGSTFRGLRLKDLRTPVFDSGFGNGAQNITIAGNFLGDSTSLTSVVNCVSGTNWTVGG